MQEQSLKYGIDQVGDAVSLIKKQMAWAQIFTITGSLGAGKTTLIRALLRSLGVTETITSPTFTYVNVYHTANKHTIYHFDLYRIGNLNEFIAHGFDEYLYQSNSYCFIEWPDVIAPLLKKNVCSVALEYTDDARIMTIKSLHER